jgi:hypothetical protein
MSDTSGGFNILSGLAGVAKGAGSIGGAVSDLFAAKGDKAEATNYTAAAALADKNAQYTELSTGIKNMQADRQIYQTIGQQQADVAGAGFSGGGSSGDLLRSSAEQGSLTHATLSEQGLIQEQGYQEQAASYRTMASSANNASTGSTIGGIIKGIAGIASLATGLPIGAAVSGFVPEAPSDPSNPLVINRYGSPGPVPNNPGTTPLGAIY